MCHILFPCALCLPSESTVTTGKTITDGARNTTATHRLNIEDTGRFLFYKQVVFIIKYNQKAQNIIALQQTKELEQRIMAHASELLRQYCHEINIPFMENVDNRQSCI